MRPVVTVEEMQAIDAAAPEPVAVLVERAGAATARAALGLLGGAYGRHVVVLAGPGNNGADGRSAARRLRARGARCTLVDAAEAPQCLPAADLVVDAAYGTGLRREHVAPDPGPALVLAVDIPSGITGDTGARLGRPMVADATVTFAALKPGLLLGDGPVHCGTVEVADIGLDVSRASIHLVDDAAAGARLPARRRAAHKWDAAVLVVAGSRDMPGAATMAAAAAQRAGAGMVQLATPGGEGHAGPVEAVSVRIAGQGWAEALLGGRAADLARIDAVVLGPGLGRAPASMHEVRALARGVPASLVVDGDGLTALGRDAGDVLRGRSAPTVLTPHDGEFARLTGAPPGPDRIGEVRALAAETCAVVLLKGPTTVVGDPGGGVRLVTAGDARLATAGTGDVLAGTIAALLAAGLDPFDAASVGAHLHGTAGGLCPDPGTVASDVVAALPAAARRLLVAAGR